MAMPFLQQFLKLEAMSAIILLASALLAMLIANSPYADLHESFSHSSLFLVNEGLMALFFLVVGLELKRSFTDGQFTKLSQIILPAVAALGGMLIPAFLYYFINRHDVVTARGWSIPIATDIAFAVGVLSLFGKRIPYSLKLFLLTLAIFDDIGAIIVIALFYSHDLNIVWMLAIVALLLALLILQRSNSKTLMFYLLLGVLLWIAFLKANIHPAITGFIFALFIPDDKTKQTSLLRTLEKNLHSWVAYLVMPLFAFVNAGIRIDNLSFNMVSDHVFLGIVIGLFVGKQFGVFIFSWLLIRLKMAHLPTKSSWLGLYGVALLCGIGFTMSLFLGTLSFPNQNIYLAEVKLGVIVGSVLSGIMGAIVLALFSSKIASQRG